jgi:hypothetical protein
MAGNGLTYELKDAIQECEWPVSAFLIAFQKRRGRGLLVEEVMDEEEHCALQTLAQTADSKMYEGITKLCEAFEKTFGRMEIEYPGVAFLNDERIRVGKAGRDNTKKAPRLSC